MRLLPTGLGLAFLLAAASQPATAGKLVTLHSFCTDASCSDGQAPHQIVLDSRGNLVGPTFTGTGTTLKGALFQLQPKGQRSRLDVLHTFCSHLKRHCLDGEFAFGAPSLDSQGNLYGGTEHGGRTDNGIVYKLTPTEGGYSFDVIYSFCPERGCRDGRGSDGTYAIDAAGNVYGTAFGGGAHHKGVLFELSPGKRHYTYKVLYDFCAQARCADGREPLAGVTYVGASSGLPYDGVSPLYGATDRDGAHGGDGVVFQLTPGESGWSEKVLFTFCQRHQCQSGGGPAEYGALQFDGAGNIYGATRFGGAKGSGTIYKLTPTQSGEWTQTVLHDFCSKPDCDFDEVEGNPVLDAAGDLIGTTGRMLYKLDMTGETPKLKVLHDFGGGGPEANVVIDDAGNIYGTTVSGGTGGAGTVFEYKP